jgi:hypothetical protein
MRAPAMIWLESQKLSLDSFLVFSLEFKEDTAIGGQLADLLFSMTAS